jgi:hypothetical protein
VLPTRLAASFGAGFATLRCGLELIFWSALGPPASRKSDRAVGVGVPSVRLFSVLATPSPLYFSFWPPRKVVVVFIDFLNHIDFCKLQACSPYIYLLL